MLKVINKEDDIEKAQQSFQTILEKCSDEKIMTRTGHKGENSNSIDKSHRRLMRGLIATAPVRWNLLIDLPNSSRASTSEELE